MLELKKVMERMADLTATEKEQKHFSGKHNDKVRGHAWSAIPYFAKRLRERLDIFSEAAEMLTGRKVVRALTMACGDMKGEYAGFKKLHATSIDAFDISEGQRKRCYEKVYDGGIPLNYEIADVNTIRLERRRYDIVYMQQSLHHITNVEHVLSEICASLKDDGLFLLNDYVGEPFLQRGPKQRELCGRIWSTLPARLRTGPDGTVYEQLFIPRKEALSPFEAIRSDAIVPALETTFEIYKQTTFAGILFPIFNNFAQCYSDSEHDLTLIKLMYELDEVLVENGTVEPSFIRGIYRRKQ